MSQVYDFIKECSTFFVLTSDCGHPAGRPFGAIMEYENDLYVCTDDMKSVYAQMKTNPKVQLLALKPGTRQWARVDGIAEECFSPALRQKMLEECPVLLKHYPNASAQHYALFRVQIESAEMY